MTLLISLIVDASVLTACAMAILRLPQAHVTHPGVIYVMFHLFVVTFRGWVILAGAPTFLYVSHDEVAKTVYVCDVMLAALTLGWVWSARRPSPAVESATPRKLNRNAVILTSIVGIPLGLYFLARYGFIPGEASQRGDVTTSYQTTAITWPGLLLDALIYRFGFRWWLVVVQGAYLSVMALQGAARVRMVIPLVLLVFIYLERRRRRWPPMPVVLSVGALALMFPILKVVGKSLQAGTANVGSTLALLKESISTSVAGTNGEQSILDMIAAGVAQGDKLGHPLWGRHFLDLLYLPIPRPWMPDKPPTNSNIDQLSDAARPLSTLGTVLGLPGEAYTDFRWIGVVVIGVLFGIATGLVFRYAFSSPPASSRRLFYLAFAASLIQVYRDGLVSLVLFGLVYLLPMLAVFSFGWIDDYLARHLPNRSSFREEVYP